MRMRDGNMASPVEIESHDELGQVVHSFNEIATALTRSSAYLKAVVDYAVDGIISINEAGIIQSFNPAAEKIFGYEAEEVLGNNVKMLMPESYHTTHDAGMKRHIETGTTTVIGSSVEVEGQRKDGSIFPLDLALNDMHVGDTRLFLGTVRDITHTKKLQSQMEHTQRLESLGMLAGGIAHDFNNLLTPILGNAALAAMKLDDDSPVMKYLEQIEQSSERAATLCQQMLAYSGKGQFEVNVIDLSEMVQEMTQLLEVSISKHAQLNYHLAESALPTVKVDVAQMQQVIMNLIINASDSMGDENGEIYISTGIMDADSTYLNSGIIDEQLPEGGYVYLEVSDTGCGMDKETQARIFDPFFTTKALGHGLGMSAVLGIIKAHKGVLKLYSEPGQGTMFRILLPTSDQPAIEDAEDEKQEKRNWTGKGTVLVVDDEEDIRNMAAGMLEEMGFECFMAENGKQGVDTFRQHQKEITAVLLDMTMPEMNGEQAFGEIRRINPAAEVIICSGYSESDAMRRLTSQGLSGFLHKPYGMEKLGDKLHEVLETRTQGDIA